MGGSSGVYIYVRVKCVVGSNISSERLFVVNLILVYLQYL